MTCNLEQGCRFSLLHREGTSPIGKLEVWSFTDAAGKQIEGEVQQIKKKCTVLSINGVRMLWTLLKICLRRLQINLARVRNQWSTTLF